MSICSTSPRRMRGRVSTRLRFSDLKARGIVRNRATLKNRIKKDGFPTGQLTGPNERTWGEDEIADWVASRPTAPKAVPQLEGKRGRPRKTATTVNNTTA
jgi:hypothetical protein